MRTSPQKLPIQFGRAAVQMFAANERMNQILIEHLDPAAWRAKTTANPPGAATYRQLIRGRAALGTAGKVPTLRSTVRTIAAIFTHMHNMRCKWVRLTAPHLKVPRQLNRARCTPRQARAGLAESGARCAEMLAEAGGNTQGSGGDRPKKFRIEKFHRDGWARPWPVGVEMLCYMLAHEAHHRGQVCMLAHQLGFPLPIAVTSGIWNWEKLWKECGAPDGPG